MYRRVRSHLLIKVKTRKLCARLEIYMNSNVWFDGVNLALPMDKIAAEIKQRIDNRHSGELAEIADALILHKCSRSKTIFR